MADLLYCITIICFKHFFFYIKTDQKQKGSRLRAEILHNQTHIKLYVYEMYSQQTEHLLICSSIKFKHSLWDYMFKTVGWRCCNYRGRAKTFKRVVIFGWINKIKKAKYEEHLRV